MSNDPSTSAPIQAGPTPDLVATLSHLVDRIASLESRLDNSSPMEATTHVPDSAITDRLPDQEFHPYPRFIEALPGFRKDFFRNPLPEVERRRFLAECPRNVDREYTPPVLNSINVGQVTKRFDSQLADIQFRLSSITRPLDLFLHKVLQNGSVSQTDATEFINVVHELLLDSASHITQLRVDNMFRGAGIQGQAPRLVDSTTSPLVDPKVLLDHVNLDKSLSQIGRRGNSRQQRGKAHSPPHKSENAKSDIPSPPAGSAKPHSDHHQKGFHPGRSFHDKGKRPETRQ